MKKKCEHFVRAGTGEGMRKILFSIFLFLMLSSAASATYDDVERYPTGSYTNYWTYTSTSASEYYSASVIADPTLAENHVLKIRVLARAMYPASGTAAALTSNSNVTFNINYISFIMDTCYYSGGNIKLRYLKPDGTQIFEWAPSSTWESGHKYEFIKSGDTTIQIYEDGVFVTSVYTSVPWEDNVRIQFYIFANSGEAYAYIDDITDTSMIGTPPRITESVDNFVYTWSAQLMRSYLDSDYTVSLYSLTNSENSGLVRTWNIPEGDNASTSEYGYVSIPRHSIIGNNFGLYLLEMTRDGEILADTYFMYDSLSNPIGYPETLFMGTADVSADIRDTANNGGLIRPGGSVYLYAEDGEGTGKYPVSFELKNTPYNFRAEFKSVYGNELINSSTVTFKSLTNNYFVSVDGKSLSPSKAAGTLTFSGNVTDGETVTVGSDVYEFESSGGVAGSNIQVNIGENVSVSASNLAAKINANGTEAVSASSELAVVTITADDFGSTGNNIATTETCANAEFEAVKLSGGDDGSTVTSDTWSYELTDWTNYTSHVFQFSPDLTQPGVYGYVKDLSTEQPLHGAKVTISNDTSSQIVTTDETGFYYLTEGMAINSAYTISAARSGYLATDKFAISTKASATSRKDLYMDPVASDGSGIYYSPHYVRFVVTDKYLFERYSGANVTISGTNATTTTQMTGADGVCGFLMTESTRYAINTVYGSINQTDYITPTENSYFIILDAVGASLLPTSQFYETCNITITKNEVNSSHATITATYSDTGTGTNSVYFVLGQTYSNNNTLNVMETSNVGTGNMTYTFTVQDYVGEDYVIKAVVNHDSFGYVEKYYGINFPGSALPFKGNMIIALVVLVFFVVAMQWGKADAHMGAVLICGLGWWFYYLDIFEKLGSATNTVIGVGLGLATVYAVLSMINKKRDEGGI